jgi:two-component system sensor histidine kinase and response regulator WspE
MVAFDPSQADPAMLELFQAEMDAHIPVLNQGLLALEKGLAGAREIEAMMRAAHSIKGAARIVGIEPAVRVSHVMEDCFTAAKDKRIELSSDSVDVLLQGVDALQRICSPQEGAALAETTLQDLLNQIGLVRDGKATPVRAVAAEAVALPATTASKDLVAATVRRDEPSVTLPAVFDDASSAALRQEMLDTLSLRPARIQVDFAQVGQLTAAALALLVAFAAEAGANEPVPAIEGRGVCASAKSVLQVAGLAGAFGLGSV